MNPTRYNSFNQVHKGLRAFLYDTALKLQQSDLSDKESAEGAIQQVGTVVELFESHAHHEDHYFNEPLEEVNPEIARLFEKEHEEDHRLGIVLQNQLQEWHQAATPEARYKAGIYLFYTFNEFLAFNLYHMNKEEITLNKALWEAYTDEQIIATEQALVQSVPPQKMAVNIKWMLRGINNPEIIKWIKGIRDNAPAEVYGMVKMMAQQELDSNRWSIVREALETQQAVLES